jgi:hypothetical protein
MIYFTAHTINCMCHSIRTMFRVLGIYNLFLIKTCNLLWQIWPLLLRSGMVSNFFSSFSTAPASLSIPVPVVELKNSKLSSSESLESSSIVSSKSKVVYMLSKILQLTVGSRNSSQAEKKKLLLLQAEQIHIIHSNGSGWKKLSFWVKIIVIFWVAQLVTTVIFSQLEIIHVIKELTEAD